MKRPYVVLVDDCPDESMLASRIINKYETPVDLISLRDGLEAIDLLTSPGARIPDLVLVDNKMPRLCGVDLIRQLNEKEKLWDVPMVLISCRLTHDEVKAAYRAGARSCVDKGQDIVSWNRQMHSVLAYWLEINRIDAPECA